MTHKEEQRRFVMSRKLDKERADHSRKMFWHYCGDCVASYTVSICPRCLKYGKRGHAVFKEQAEVNA